MAARNTAESFGWVTRSLHWAIALGVLFMLPLGAFIVRMEVGFANFWLFGLHKSIGILVFALLLMRVLWHFVSHFHNLMDTFLLLCRLTSLNIMNDIWCFSNLPK